MPRNEWKLAAPGQKYGTAEVRSPSPNILDAVIIERIPIRDYTQVCRGMPHPKVASAILVHESPVITDGFVSAIERFYCTLRSGQDTYNGDVTFDKGNKDFPIFKRTYFEPQSGYYGGGDGAPIAKGAILSSLVFIQLTAGGSGYLPDGQGGFGSAQLPLVFSGGTGSGATGVAEILQGVVLAVCLTNGGSYTVAPSVAVDSSGGGSGAAVSVSLQEQTAVLFDEVFVKAQNEFADIFNQVTRSYKILPGPLLTSYDQDPEYGFASTQTEQEVTAASQSLPTPATGNTKTITAMDSLRSILKNDDFSSQIDAYYEVQPCMGEIDLPKILAGITITWDVALGTGQYNEKANGIAEEAGSSTSLALNTQGKGQGSASVLADVTPLWVPHPTGRVPFVDYLFFLPSPVTQTAIINRCTAIATAIAGSATTVDALPLFQTIEHTLFISGQKVSLSSEATAKCAISVSTGGQGVSLSESTSSGSGENTDKGSNVKSVTLPACINGTLAFNGPTTISATANSKASAVITPGINWPGASAMDSHAAAVTGGVIPDSLTETPVTAWPASGLIVYDYQTKTFKKNYTMIVSRIFNFGLLNQTVNLGQPQITVADFNGLTGANFVVSQQQITTVNFTGLTGANFIAALQQITTVGFTGLTGAHFVTSVPQITTVDFTGLSGANFVTGSAGKGFTLPSTGTTVFGIWFNTGTETPPTLSGATTYVSVTISATATASAIATALKTTIAGTAVWTTSSTGAVTTLTSNALILQSNAADVNTGATITVTQEGAQNPGRGFLLPSASSGTYGIWFDTGTETQPTLAGATTYLQIGVGPTDSALTLATDLVTGLASVSAIWTASATSATATITSVARAVQAAASDLTSGAAITVTQLGTATGDGHGFLLPSATLGIFGVWFDTGTETQPSLGNVATYVRVPITTGSSAATIAGALSTAFAGYSATWTVGASSATTTFTSVSFAAQDSASDVSTGATITVTQAAGNAAGKYFNIYGYQIGNKPTAIWFNTGNEVAPVTQSSAIQVAISPTATAADIAAATVAAAPAAVGTVWLMAQINGGGTNTAAQFTAVANQAVTDAADVTSGAAISTTQAGVNPGV